MNKYLRLLQAGVTNAGYMDEATDGVGDTGGSGGANHADGEPEVTVESLQAQMAEQAKLMESLQAANDKLSGDAAAAAKAKKAADDLAAKQKLEAAKAAGKVEEVSQHLEAQYGAQIAEMQKTIDGLNGEIVGGKKSQIIESLASKFQSPEGGRLMLQSMVQVNRGEDGAITTQFTGHDGSVVGTTVEQFNDYLANNKQLSPFLNGPGSTGGGSSGGAGGQSAKNTISRAEFSAMTPSAQGDFMAKGGKLRD
ncbi:MAG: hypothetical protein ACN2B6_00205 [Rickettsiales bacterium]